MATRNIIVRVGSDIRPLQDGLKGAQKSLGNFSSGANRSLAGMQRGMNSSMTGMTGSLSRFNSSLFMASAAVAGLSTVITTRLVGAAKEAVKAFTDIQSANLGLQALLAAQGQSFTSAKGFIDNYISDGLVPLSEAVTAYKNLSMRGYNEKQIQDTMVALKDSASFGRQAALTMGEAVRSATEGIKNENSILSDNAGITKNLSKMWLDYARSIGVGVDQLTLQQKITAENIGFQEQAALMQGNAALYAKTLAGQMSALGVAVYMAKAALGSAFAPVIQFIIPYLIDFAGWVKAIIEKFNELAPAVRNGIIFAVAAFALYIPAAAALIAMQTLLASVTLVAMGQFIGLGLAIAAVVGVVAALFGSKVMGAAKKTTDDTNKALEDMRKSSKLAKTGQDALTDSLKDSAKAANKNIQGFDELNLIQEELAGSGAGVGAGIGSGITMPDITIPTITIPDISEALQGLGDKVKKFFKETPILIPVNFQTPQPPPVPPAVVTSWLMSVTAACAAMSAAFGKWATETTLSFITWSAGVGVTIATWAIVTGLIIGTWVTTMATSIATWATNTGLTIGMWVTGTALSIGVWAKNIAATVATWAINIATSIATWAINTALSIATWVTNTALSLKTWAINTGLTISTWATNTALSLKTWVTNAALSLRTWATNTALTILTWAANTALTISTWVSGTAAAIGSWITGTLTAMSSWAVEAYKQVNQWAQNSWEAMSGFLSGSASSVATWANSVLTTIGTWASGVYDKIKSLASSVGDTLSNSVSSSFDRIKNGFEGMGKWVSQNQSWLAPVGVAVAGIAATAALVAGAPVAAGVAVTAGLAGLIAPNIPKELGLKVPKMAAGGIVNRPTLAQIGESGAEAVIPLENGSFVDTLASAVGSAVLSAMQFVQGGQSNNNNNGDIILNIDGTKIARVLIPVLDKERSRLGKVAIQTA